MRLILFLIFTVFVIGTSCKSPQKVGESSISQGIYGTVGQLTGNQMPRIGQSPAVPKPYPTTVFFYEPTNISQVIRVNESSPLYVSINTKILASVNTDSTGAFKIALPVGTYSVFVQVGQQFFANTFDIRNNISLVSVEKGKMTEVKIVVNNAAAY